LEEYFVEVDYAEVVVLFDMVAFHQVEMVVLQQDYGNYLDLEECLDYILLRTLVDWSIDRDMVLQLADYLDVVMVERLFLIVKIVMNV
jgi:hypothetical protein